MTSAPIERERDPFRASRSSPRVRWRLLPWWGKVALVYIAARAVTTASCSPSRACRARTRGRRRGPVLRVRQHVGRAVVPDRLARRLPRRPAADRRRPGGRERLGVPPGVSGARRRADLAGHPVERRVGGGRRGRGLGAALVFHRLMSRFLEPDRALFAVVLFCVAPVSPIMQFGYAESLGFLWLALALLLLVERRYAWLFPVILAWSFTRPGRSRSRWPSPCTGRGGGSIADATRSRCASGCSPPPSRCSRVSPGLSWVGIARVGTGDLHAYTDTELAWRSAYIGYHELVPFTAWFQSGTGGSASRSAPSR